MSDTTKATEQTGDTSVSVIQVPNEHAEKVLEYAKSLEQAPDVTGYDYSGSVVFRRITLSGSGCATTGGTGRPSDFSCQDEDH